MAVPTLDELSQHIEELTAARQDEESFCVFEWEYLARMCWRRFRTTSPAVKSRMKELLENGALVGVRISSHGFVYPEKLTSRNYGTLYFQYDSGYREDYGYVTAERVEGHKNVWRAEFRALYVTAEQFSRMTAHFSKVKQERDAKERAEKEEQNARLWELLEKESPGARQVLDDLYCLLSDSGDRLSQVEARLWEVRDTEAPTLTIGAQELQSSVLLIDIIRRGLRDTGA